MDDRAKCEALKAQIATDGIETFGEVAKEHSSCALFAPHPHPPSPPQNSHSLPPTRNRPTDAEDESDGRPRCAHLAIVPATHPFLPYVTPIPPICHDPLLANVVSDLFLTISPCTLYKFETSMNKRVRAAGIIFWSVLLLPASPLLFRPQRKEGRDHRPVR